MTPDIAASHGALIPPPRSHVLSCYGVPGAAAARRDEIVPVPPPEAQERVPRSSQRRQAARSRGPTNTPRRPRITLGDQVRTVI